MLSKILRDFRRKFHNYAYVHIKFHAYLFNFGKSQRKIHVILRREYQRMFGYFLKFMRLMSSMSLISQNGRPHFASVIKRLAPYPEISFHCVSAKKQFSRENLRRLVGRSNVFQYKTTRKFTLYTYAFIASSLQIA